jgi:murein DD-endopeptidase MepM/ murein hydrolase activator NlpD
VKNRLCITLTHVKGSHQFGISKQNLKRLAFFSLFMLSVIVIYPLWLNYFNDQLSAQNTLLERNKQLLLQQTALLSEKHQQLSSEFQSQQEDLTLSKHQLTTLLQQVSFEGGNVLANQERFQAISNQLAFRKMVLQLIPNGRPVNYDRVTSSFGSRFHPFYKKNYQHKGIDVHSFVGTEVVATADGMVSSIQNTPDGFGKLIKVSHGMGFVTYYGHLKRINVDRGQIVSKGETIGLSGNTGRSTGPHLHYEVRYGEKPLDPANFILWTLNNFESQLEKIQEIPWGSLMVSLQKRLVVQPLPSSPLIATSKDTLILMAACTSTGGCPATSSVAAP